MSETLSQQSGQEAWVKSLADRIVAEAGQAMDAKIRPVEARTREDMAIEAYTAEVATSMPEPSVAQKVQARVDAEEADVAAAARKAAHDAWYQSLSDEQLGRLSVRVQNEQSRRAPAVDDDDELAEFTEGYTAEYGDGSAGPAGDDTSGTWFADYGTGIEEDDEELTAA